MASANTPITQRNLILPLSRGPRGLATAMMYTRYHTAVHNFIKTPLGSLRWALGYGSMIDELRTQNLTDAAKSDARALLVMGLNTFIPDITVYDVLFTKLPTSNRLEVLVKWDIPNASPRDPRGNAISSTVQSTAVQV